MTQPRIRPVTVDDLPAVADLYAHYVQNTTATWATEAPTVAQWQELADEIAETGRPFLVLEDEVRLRGFAYLSRYRGMAGWASTVENTIYLDPDSGGRGWGTLLLTALLDAGRAAGNVRQVVAMISSSGADGSVELHRKCGFVNVGRLTGVGTKHGEELDCILMQTPLDSATTTAGSSLEE